MNYKFEKMSKNETKYCHELIENLSFRTLWGAHTGATTQGAHRCALLQ
jgi:hypothetical protein